MRFCTTCGRNFDNSVAECPHDGTPLFEMHGGDDAADNELQSDGGAFLGDPADGDFESVGQAPLADNRAEHADFDAAGAPVLDDDADLDAFAPADQDDEVAAPNFAEVDEDPF